MFVGKNLTSRANSYFISLYVHKFTSYLIYYFIYLIPIYLSGFMTLTFRIS